MAARKTKSKSRSGTKWSEQDYRDAGWGPQRKLRFRQDIDDALAELAGKGRLAETISELVLEAVRAKLTRK